MNAPLRSALWLPLSDELADPMVVARLAAEAEEAGARVPPPTMPTVVMPTSRSSLRSA
jgi:hypothetical protein